MSKNLIFLIVLLLIISASFVYAKEFFDVPVSHWAYNYIDELSNHGVINGYSDGRFNPTGTITKAEYLKLLITTILPKDEIKELQNKQVNYANWFEPYIEVIKEKKIITENYSINDLKGTVARKEMATLIVEFSNYAGLKSKQTSGSQTFTDLSSVTYGEQKSIYSAFELGLVTGYDDGSFKPDNLMTRAEVATIVYRFADAYNHKDDVVVEEKTATSGDNTNSNSGEVLN